MHDGFYFYDMFATKGIEYITVIAFLLLFVLYWRWLNPKPAQVHYPTASVTNWFQLPEDRYFHPGHSWALPERDGTVKIGLDDFALKMLGGIDHLILPRKNRLKQGESNLQVEVNSKKIPIITPLDGEIIEVNRGFSSADDDNDSSSDWLVRIRPLSLKADLRNLLKGSLAHLWFQSEIKELNDMMSNRPGIVLQDGGVLVNGFARELDAANWEQVARRFLRTSDD